MKKRPQLPQLLNATLGAEATAVLLRECGGTRIWVPVQPSEFLIRLLGDDAAAKLCRYWGREYLKVPTGSDGDYTERWRTIAALARQGMKIDDIAVQAQCSRRTVFRVLRMPVTELRA